MEIRDYLSDMGWRLWVLILLPILAGGTTYWLSADTPSQYQATSVLTVPSSVAGGSSSGSVAQYMANFEQSIVSEPVLKRVSRETAVAESEIAERLTTSQLGSSNLVEVSYQGSNSDKAAEIVAVATRASFELVAEIQLPEGIDALESRLASASAELTEADNELQAFLLRNGLVLPREEYLMIAADVRRLQDEILRAETAGASPVLLEAALEERRQELDELSTKVPEYERLQADVDRAEEDVDSVQDELRLAENQLGQLEPQLTDVRIDPVARIQIIGRGVAVSAAIAFIVALGLVVLFPPKKYKLDRQQASSPPPPAAANSHLDVRGSSAADKDQSRLPTRTG